MRQFHLVKNDSADIGFATTCLIGGIITFSEFKDWLYFVIENTDEVPNYFFDILDIDEKFDYTLRTVNYLGFHPSWDASEVELLALDGIAFLRFHDHQTDASQREGATSALRSNPHVEERFRETFPFIEF
ncbi:hypothetical protein [Ruegeria sp. ANG-R]|uniref:hypothetical protein n=1 Tax=Ruegeria sp. ANG-R TaxID=1577903 RepID=UPI00068F1863|nr:hypothetical protein [Ruegeria sp. ANG-R]